MEKDYSIFMEQLREFNIKLSDKQLQQFNDYYEVLIEKNKVMNLTAITEFNEVLVKHFVDSISCVKVIDLNEVNSVIDVGTGAGFPGIPLKIVFPHLKITLLDSLNKRVDFLNETIKLLNLDNSIAIHGRAEDYSKNSNYRESFDLCVSRAVANYATLAEYCLPFVNINGTFISYKSTNGIEELKESEKAIKILGGEFQNLFEFTLPKTDIERTFLVTKKKKPTPMKYPRKAGIPSRNPIK